MQLDFQSAPTLTLLGYSPEKPRRIFSRVRAGAKPSSLKGDFVLVVEGHEAGTGEPLTVFISTVVAAVPHFYTRAGTHWVHANNVFECCKAAGLAWRWNWDALAQLVMFEHVLGNVSLHTEIERVPSRSVVRLCGAKREISSEPFWTEMHAHRRLRTLPMDAAEVLLEVLAELPATGEYSLSLSAGYDSRLLLAALTRLKRHTATACMGSPEATDPRIAAQLARAMGCEFRRIEIDPVDYAQYASDIVRTTSGEKIFWDWHTAIYSRKVGFDPGAMHLAGSNGEFARSYFFDKGFAAVLLDHSHYSRWDRWLSHKNSHRRRVVPAVLAALEREGDFSRALDARRQLDKAFVAKLRFGDGLDYFYTAERVRNFIGQRLALYRSSFPTMSPFLDARFIRAVAHLPRRDKLADRMHRAVIGKLQPALLDFPTDDSGRTMRAPPEHLYFLKRRPSNACQRHTEAQKLPQVAQWARSGFEVLSARRAPDPGTELDTEVTRWNHAITVGATRQVLEDMRIPMA